MTETADRYATAAVELYDLDAYPAAIIDTDLAASYFVLAALFEAAGDREARRLNAIEARQDFSVDVQAQGIDHLNQHIHQVTNGRLGLERGRKGGLRVARYQ